MRRLWLMLSGVMAVSFAVLGWIGTRIYQEMPPIPDRVVTTEGKAVIEPGAIAEGQNVWQTMGGMEVGSVWGHGSYVAPDWTADCLHRECAFLLDRWAEAEFHGKYDALPLERQAQLRGRLESMMRPNTYDAATKTLTVDPARAAAFEANVRHYDEVFREGRVSYAIPKGTLTDPAQVRKLASFFFWTAWAGTTNRPEAELSYTNNWPHEPLVGNRPTGETVTWTGVSVIMLLAGIGGMVWWYASQSGGEGVKHYPEEDPLRSWAATPSQRATRWFFWVVAGMILVQMLLGVVTAHYGVEGDGFYGIPLSKWLPYSVTRTWHVQLGVLWIATSWLGAGLFIGPLIGGEEPKAQRALVFTLLGALVVVVAGSMTGQYLSIANQMSDATAFYLGHQGYEYFDLGRVWQIALFAGTAALALSGGAIDPAGVPEADDRGRPVAALGAAALDRGHRPVLRVRVDVRPELASLDGGVLAVVGGSPLGRGLLRGLRHGRDRLLLRAAGTRPGRPCRQGRAPLGDDLPGRRHHRHLPPPLLLRHADGRLGVRLGLQRAGGRSAGSGRLRGARRPACIAVHDLGTAVSLADLLLHRRRVLEHGGRGLFGFMINPPIALYFMQGLNTTPVHGHAALFGVYGMLGMGLMLMCLRALTPGKIWKEGPIKFAFWAMNIGLMAMCVLSLLPVGLMQTWASVNHGYWYARSTEFMTTPTMQTLRWMRVPGDTLFAIGELVIVLFLFGLSTGHSFRPGVLPSPIAPGRRPATREPIASR